jgi:hypothetical protein
MPGGVRNDARDGNAAAPGTRHRGDLAPGLISLVRPQHPEGVTVTGMLDLPDCRVCAALDGDHGGRGVQTECRQDRERVEIVHDDYLMDRIGKRCFVSLMMIMVSGDTK